MGTLECFDIKTLKHELNGVKSIFSEQAMNMATKVIAMSNTFVKIEWRQKSLRFKRGDRRS